MPSPFVSKTYDMVDDPSTNFIISWSPSNNSFVIWEPTEFAKYVMPLQLNAYGFRKVDPARLEYAHESFLRGQRHLLKSIGKEKPVNVQTQQQQPRGQSSSVGACAVGNPL
ncbi:hypothetical protein MKW92_033863 [Papaver armeniacum]|nr:hypothetical protein MKW92_033863 [Papaver armeniacum]